MLRLAADIPLERPTLSLAAARDYLGCGPRRLAATFRYILEDRVERKLHHVHTPAVVVRGSCDPIVPLAWAREVAALLPRGSFSEVPGTGHAVNYSAPAELARMIRSLLLEART